MAPPQDKQRGCSGVLIVTQNDAKCFGLRTTLAGALDLAEWHRQERPDVAPGELLAAACIGRSVYNAAAQRAGSGSGSSISATSGEDSGPQPPACLGLEWLRYRDLVLEARANAPATAPALPALPPVGATVGRVPAAAAAAASVSARAADGAATTAAVPSTVAAGDAAAGVAPQPAPASSSSAQPARPNSSGSSGSWLDDALARARLVARSIKDEHLGADADVLWFARRFYKRAQINADAMGRTALQLLAAATGSLPPDDATD